MQGLPQPLQVGDHLLRRAEVGLGDNLDERHAAAVVVDFGLLRPGVVDQLARVLLHVQLVNAHGAAPHLHRPVPADGQIELGDLVGLGQIGVEVVFPVEPAVPGDGAAQGQGGPDGVLHHLPVEHGQRPGMPVHTGQQWVLGAPPNAVVQAQKILLLVASST